LAQIVVQEGQYFSPSDEKAFFEWLQSIPGVKSVAGTPEGLVIELRSRRMSRTALYELLALHARYGLPMNALAQFKTAENESWFADPKKYWYQHVFGESNHE
jgi:hypothetical protein